MFAQALVAAALVASSAFTSALPAPANAQQAVAVAKQDQISSTLLSTPQTISPDGTCGGENGYTCAGSTFGNCCSTSGLCGSTQAFCAISKCISDFGLCGSEKLITSQPKSVNSEEEDDTILSYPSEADDVVPAVVRNNIVPLAPSPTITSAMPVHTPWKPTPFRDYVHRPSYVIDNGERAPNQVWN